MEDWAISGADFWVHGSNLLLLVGYTRRDMIPLRIFALAAALTIIPYYVVQPTVLWPPILWSGVYAGVHGYHLFRLILERRPFKMTVDEQRLYERNFSSLQPFEFRQVIDSGEWSEAELGSRLQVDADEVLLLFEGRIRLSRGGAEITTLAPGQLVGVALQIEQALSGFELEATTPVRLVRWSLSILEAQMEESPQIRAALTALLNHDLARKLLAQARGGSTETSAA